MVFMNVRETITLQLKNVLREIFEVEIEPQLGFPSEMQFGDYSTNVAMVAWGKMLPDVRRQMSEKGIKSPIELAERIATDFKSQVSDGVVKDIQVVKPGFINFWVSDKALLRQLEDVAKLQRDAVIVDAGKGKKVVVEYSSPNIAKPFTIGHLRSTIIGDAVANLLQATGWTVYRDNHVGDWGTQFGKQIYAIKTWGDEKALDASANPVNDLVALYVKFHEEAEKDPLLEEEGRKWFKRLENGDAEAKRLWKKCIDWSWKEFAKIYNELGVPSWKNKENKRVKFENEGKGYGESYFEDKMRVVIEELEAMNLLHEGENGAKLVFFPDEKYPPLMILKKDGATLYATRDLATDRFRLDTYGKDVVIINEIGAEQSLYMNQLYLTEELLGWVKKGQRIHIKHGLYRFKEGKMSTRKGNVIWLEDVLAEAGKRAFVAMDTAEKQLALSALEQSHLALAVGIGALKWNDLKRDAVQDIAFDWDDALNMDGNSGPYMQYAYARTKSVLSKSSKFKVQSSKFALNNLVQEERDLLRWVGRFDAVVVESAGRYAPNILCNYLFVLAQLFNLFYQKCPILKAEESVRDFRLELVAGVSTIIGRGLAILGIETPDRM
jgi:arginyl-tRNA synthetase